MHTLTFQKLSHLLIFTIICLMPAKGAFGADTPVISKGPILIVLSAESHITLKGNKKHPTGFYLNELAVPLKQMVDNGFTPVFATPKGKIPVMDKHSDNASVFGGDQDRYASMKEFLSKEEGLKHPHPLSEIASGDLSQYRGIFVPGGHAPMQDLWKDPNLGKILTYFHDKHIPTGLICHGTIALLSSLDDPTQFLKSVEKAPAGASPKNAWIYDGYRMTVFSIPEERDAQKNMLKGEVKFFPEDALTQAGGKVMTGPKWQSYVIHDRELVTGQNPNSDQEFGKIFLEMLKSSESKS